MVTEQFIDKYWAVFFPRLSRRVPNATLNSFLFKNKLSTPFYSLYASQINSLRAILKSYLEELTLLSLPTNPRARLNLVGLKKWADKFDELPMVQLMRLRYVIDTLSHLSLSKEFTEELEPIIASINAEIESLSSEHHLDIKSYLQQFTLAAEDPRSFNPDRRDLRRLNSLALLLKAPTTISVCTAVTLAKNKSDDSCSLVVSSNCNGPEFSARLSDFVLARAHHLKTALQNIHAEIEKIPAHLIESCVNEASLDLLIDYVLLAFSAKEHAIAQPFKSISDDLAPSTSAVVYDKSLAEVDSEIEEITSHRKDDGEIDKHLRTLHVSFFTPSRAAASSKASESSLALLHVDTQTPDSLADVRYLIDSPVNTPTRHALYSFERLGEYVLKECGLPRPFKPELVQAASKVVHGFCFDFDDSIFSHEEKQALLGEHPIQFILPHLEMPALKILQCTQAHQSLIDVAINGEGLPHDIKIDDFHAEQNLALYLSSDTSPFEWLEHKKIGIDKLCCTTCSEVLDKLGASYYGTSGSAYKVYNIIDNVVSPEPLAKGAPLPFDNRPSPSAPNTPEKKVQLARAEVRPTKIQRLFIESFNKAAVSEDKIECCEVGNCLMPLRAS